MKRRREVLQIIAMFSGVTAAVFAYRHDGSADNKRHDIVVVSAPRGAGRAAIRPASTLAGLRSSVSDVRADVFGSDAAAFPDPAVEAVLERGAKADMSASQQRMLERQKSTPDYASSPAIDAPEAP